ncbi:MAG: sigma-54-dependent Fis family transcriptional regulator [Acidobacteria bacterium]|nr:sigma-54-dependent Fis family transcriptional regulator [Acidobacteriota bacterium]
MASYELGDVVGALTSLRSAFESADKTASASQRFFAALALFSRESQFQSPEESLPLLSKVRQLAASIADASSLGGLHFVVARLEAMRGHYVNSHRHLELGRRLLSGTDQATLRSSVELVECGLETYAGNFGRAGKAGRAGLRIAEAAALSVAKSGCLINLGSMALYMGQSARAGELVAEGIGISEGLLLNQLSGLDTLAQVALFDDQLAKCCNFIETIAELEPRQALPARSWYDLAHQITRCAYHERLQDWDAVVLIAEAADGEVSRRQYKPIRTALLSARARALARLGRHDEADETVALAMRVCPRSAVDPLIVLEATKGLTLTLRGEQNKGAVHFDRALAACRAIGHRFHEAWIGRDRAELAASGRARSTRSPRALDVTDSALLLSDAAIILGAGHSVDLLAHRVMTLLQSSGLGDRVDLSSESGCDFQAEPSAVWDSTSNATYILQLRGSDRRLTIRMRQIVSLDDLSLMKSVGDIVRAAINQTTDVENEDDDQNLWPRQPLHDGEDVVFRSPRMLELLKVATRLASADLPILITGETGTGKEILARLIHQASRVKQGPFVPFNAPAIPRELVESQLFGHRRGAFTGATDASTGVIRAAERGTLFLDEIGDLDPAVQPKLLRFLESGEIHPVGEPRPVRVSVRVVAATNADLQQLVEAGRFRADLYYRIGAAKLALPPLRERKDEIPALASLFLARFARENGRRNLRLTDDFVAALLLYDWPGNIRELANELRRVVAMAGDGDAISCAELSPAILTRWHERPTLDRTATGPTVAIRLNQPLTQAIDELEQRFIEHALAASGGRVSDAAQLLGLSRKGLFLKRRRQGLLPRTAET